VVDAQRIANFTLLEIDISVELSGEGCGTLNAQTLSDHGSMNDTLLDSEVTGDRRAADVDFSCDPLGTKQQVPAQHGMCEVY
jgi:hypothetical protein